MALCLMLAGCAASPQSAPPLQGAALEAAFAGQKIEITQPDGVKGYLRAGEDGRASYSSASYGSFRAPWRVEGGRYCVDHPRMGCYALSGLGGRAYAAQPVAGGAPQRWFVMKRLDEEGNNYDDALR